ncbi:AAA-like domain-containing protein [Thermocoleostomius sinensis]|uniref:AAA-like domain-containing protein n=1 Tax=Thermocoleostomius sinensis A174 TaxID=2016057 RepID=A0A9E8ZE81_9CYAN|nr:AAA-like domain-containing protein [Thermocoleostomius sinensis]WAL61357.1 AAA-like domain-containing protein [Thermocoleostomius sinensis A174]
MAQSYPSKRRRRRGVVLTTHGLQKLQDAKELAELEENAGNRYTLEALSERTGLAVDTLMKVFAGEAGVDRQTLKLCFKAFNLQLETADYHYPESEPPEKLKTESLQSLSEPELPEGQVPLGSVFYMERPPIEADSYKTILQPGALIRIKGPRRMGKTSLMVRVLDYAAQQHYQTVSLSLQLADRQVFQDLNRFLQWFCASVGLGLQLPSRLTDYWDDLFGSQISCKMYFEQYLLTAIAHPLVLGLDDVDRLFQFPHLASDFFGLLRSWHEEGKNREIWKKLRLVVVHSNEVYIPLEANRSPFNVGLPIELKPFTVVQVQTLANRYGLSWSVEDAKKLMDLVDGHPFLVRQGLHHIWHNNVTLDELVQTPASGEGIYYEHLQQQLWYLQQQPELAEVFAQALTQSSTEFDLVQLSKLQSMGLVHLQGNRPVPSCRLYRQYFQSHR